MATRKSPTWTYSDGISYRMGVFHGQYYDIQINRFLTIEDAEKRVNSPVNVLLSSDKGFRIHRIGTKVYRSWMVPLHSDRPNPPINRALLRRVRRRWMRALKSQG